MQPNWAQSASPANLEKRALIIRKIRSFFEERNVLEVDTPLLCQSTTPNPCIGSFIVGDNKYLQTSPEFAMKRMLASGMGAIYQICKAFRLEESGNKHNPEFTMLEWYRPEFNHHDLMNEMDAFLQAVIGTLPADEISYQALFETHFDINPHTASAESLCDIAKAQGMHVEFDAEKDTWLDLLLTHRIESKLGLEKPIFIYDYPKSQAALSKINGNIAERFEVYYKGMELANGFHELTDAAEQRKRFESEIAERQKLKKHVPPLDERFLQALSAGMPNCAGVAVGVDRLIMLTLDTNNIGDVLAFTTKNA